MGSAMKISSSNVLNGSATDETLFKILALLPANLSFNPEDLNGLGLQDSHKYRMQFLEIATKARLTPPQIFYVIMCTVAVKNRDRIIKSLAPKTSNTDLAAVHRFMKDHCVQYVPEAGTAKFPVVKIPESFPSVSLVCAIAIWGSIEDEKKDSTIKKVTENLFFGQMNIDSAMQDIHKIWERDVFWGATESTGQVRSSKFSRRGDSVKLQFQEAFYATKAMDSYPFLKVDGSEAAFPNSQPTEEELWEYIKGVKQAMDAKKA
jgi:hypothetical protein